MELNSSLYSCTVIHDRKKPKKNFFRYRIFMFMFDLDELPLLAKRFFIFGYNKPNIFSFYDKDHFKKKKHQETGNTAKEKLIGYLGAEGITRKPEKVLLLTHPRIFGHVFNPVSFYYCYDTNEELFCVVAEVTNTYGEMKMYLVTQENGNWFREVHQKHFYISPFTQLDDYLDLIVGKPGEKLKVFINDFKENEMKVKTMLTGHKKTMNQLRLFKYIFRFPFLSIQIVSLIHWQALKLWIKGVKYIPKDENPQLQKDIYYSNKDVEHALNLVQENRHENPEQYEAREVTFSR